MTSNTHLLDTAQLYQSLYIGETLVFSICLLLLQIKTRAVYLWIFSNILAIFGTLYTLNHISENGEFRNIPALALIIISSCIKALSFADRSLTRRSSRIPSILLITALIFNVLIFISGETVFLLFLISNAGFFISLSAVLYLLSNRSWTGLPSVKYLIATFSLAAGAFIFLLSSSYPIGSRTRLIPSDGSYSYQILFLTVFVFFIQMTFIGLIVGRQSRENMFKVRKSVRIQQAISQSKANEKASAALADERYHLLKMLTHEVRQPLNTAQATLDTISHQLGLGQTEPAHIQQTVMKAQSTINSVVLSISNSILGATLITQGRPSQLQSIDLCDVSRLALFDLGQSQRSRIQQKFEQPTIYADADPIILRLAIRNLLENACKYSPAGTPVLFELVTDEDKLVLVIRVTNTLNDQSTLSADIFERNKRGVDSLYEGSGLGLYIVRKVAELHKGDVSYHLLNGNQVAFELTIPA